LHGGGNAKAVVRAPQSRDLRIDRGQPVMRAPHVQLRLVRRAQVFLRNCGEPKLLFLTSRPRTWIRFPESRIDAKLSFSGFIVVSYLSRVFGELSIVERPRTSVALGVVSILRSAMNPAVNIARLNSHCGKQKRRFKSGARFASFRGMPLR
jgi:hypothetical protein